MSKQDSSFLSTQRYAVVTGGNKGIGLEVCRQLCSHGVTVILTARDPKKGLEALDSLGELGLSDRLHFHQLDVSDSPSVASLASFVKSNFGKLDILGEVPEDMFEGTITTTYELSEVCVDANFYGAKRVTEALLPLLQSSDSARIVNVSSFVGKLSTINNEWAKGILRNIEELTEEKIDEVMNAFLQDFKEGSYAEKGWDTALPGYTISKIALNAYTRLLAKRYPLMKINCVHPGFVRTDINLNMGTLTPKEGASSLVRMALTPEGATGLFFLPEGVTSFE